MGADATEALEHILARAGEALELDAHCIEAQAWQGLAHCALGASDAGRQAYLRLAAAWQDARPGEQRRQAYALRTAAKGLAACPPRDEGAMVAALEERPTGEGLRLALVGDVHLGRGWRGERPGVTPPRKGADYFREVAHLLQSADLTLGNLETALLDEGESRKCAQKARPDVCHAFRAPTALARRLADAGFDALSLANNHAGDFGMVGVHHTLRALADAGIAGVGIGGTLHSAEVRGLRVATLAFGTNGLAYRLTDLDDAAAVVRHTARSHDIVIVSFHGGAEGPGHAHVPRKPERYLGEERGDVYAFAHAVVDAGADLVFGHGPHVWRGLELYRGRLIAYSLGNFSSWHTFPTRGPAAHTGVLEVQLAENGAALSATLHPTRLSRSGRPELDPDRSILERVRRLSEADFGDALLDAEGRWQRSLPLARVATGR